MVRIIWITVSFFLIGIIFLRMPQENIGLSSFANKSNIFGSPSSTQRILNYITGVFVLSYIFMAFCINLSYFKIS